MSLTSRSSNHFFSSAAPVSFVDVLSRDLIAVDSIR